MKPTGPPARKRLPRQLPSGIDTGQLLQNLQLTPAERLDRMVEWSRWIKAVNGHLKVRGFGQLKVRTLRLLSPA